MHNHLTKRQHATYSFHISPSKNSDVILHIIFYVKCCLKYGHIACYCQIMKSRGSLNDSQQNKLLNFLSSPVSVQILLFRLNVFAIYTFMHFYSCIVALFSILALIFAIIIWKIIIMRKSVLIRQV